MGKTYSSAEVKEIIGVFVATQSGSMPKIESMTTEGAKDLFLTNSLGDLRHWSAFSEIFAFGYDPDRLEVQAVVRANDFLGNPIEGLLKDLKERYDGASIEIWGIRHRWSSAGALPAAPECIDSHGPRPSEKSALLQMVATAIEFDASSVPSPR